MISASATHGCKVGEETITDLLVLGLTIASNGGYSVKSFNKRQEATNGADWELWLTGRSRKWFGLRIQAKIIDYAKSEYPHLHPPAKPGQLSQCQKLIDAAAAVSATPIYCLYTAWPASKTLKSKRRCATYPPKNQHFGISVVAARKVVQLGLTKDLASISPHMHPLHCLFCCLGYGGTDLPSRAMSYSSENFDENSKLLNSPPEHIGRLLSLDSQRRSDSDFLDEEYFPNTSRIIVIEEREID
jgi:hypothetical protein